VWERDSRTSREGGQKGSEAFASSSLEIFTSSHREKFSKVRRKKGEGIFEILGENRQIRGEEKKTLLPDGEKKKVSILNQKNVDQEAKGKRGKRGFPARRGEGDFRHAVILKWAAYSRITPKKKALLGIEGELAKHIHNGEEKGKPVRHHLSGKGRKKERGKNHILESRS